MSADDTTIRAVVRALDGAHADVEVEQGGCGRCHEKGGCGGQQLTQMFCSGPKTYRVSNTVGAEVGDSVTIAIAAGSVRKTANLAYILPLTATITGLRPAHRLEMVQPSPAGWQACCWLFCIYVSVRRAWKSCRVPAYHFPFLIFRRLDSHETPGCHVFPLVCVCGGVCPDSRPS